MATISAENFSFNGVLGGGWGQLGKRILSSDGKAKLRARFNCKKPKRDIIGVQTNSPTAGMEVEQRVRNLRAGGLRINRELSAVIEQMRLFTTCFLFAGHTSGMTD